MSVSKAHATPRGPVAVIAVHGVADQGKNDTAATAANLLLHLDQLESEDTAAGPRREYSGFNQRIIRVAVEPFDVSSVGSADAWQYQLRDHLEDFQGEGSRGAYETVCLEGQRNTKASAGAPLEPDRAVHVYELHWADVSRLKIGAFNIFLAIYRLLFETSWLGLQTIGTWASFGGDVGKFSSFTSLRGLMVFFHSIASVILTRVMPLMYVFLIAMLSLTAIPMVESPWAQLMLTGLGGYRGLFATGVVLGLAAILIGIAIKFWRFLPWPPLFIVVSVACFAAWNFAYASLPAGEASWWAEAGVAVMAWIGMCAAVGLVFLPMLNRLFPGTLFLGIGMMLLFTAGLVMGLAQETDWPLLFTGPILAIRTALAVLPFVWMVLATSANIFLLLAFIDGITLPFRRWLKPEVIRRKRDRLRTAILSISMPVLLISFLNSTFFQLALIPAKSGGVDGAVPIVGRTENAPAWVKAIEVVVDEKVDPFLDRFASMPSFMQWDAATIDLDVRFSDYANVASGHMVIPFLEATFLLVILVLGYSLWTVAPAALAEVTMSELRHNDTRWERLSKALGRNLSQGYRWLWAGQILLACCLLLNQGLFAYRGMRATEVREKGFEVAESDPVMVLVDRFLGVRELKFLPESALAIVTDLEASEEPLAASAPEPLTMPEPAPVALAPAVPAAAAAPEALRPAVAVRPVPRSAPASPVIRSQPSGRVDRFGRPMGGRRIEVLPERASRSASRDSGSGSAPAQPAQTVQTVQQQIVQEERQEIRQTIQEILQPGPDISALKELPAQPDGAPVAAYAPAPAPPKWVLNTLTELAIFFNQGPLTSALGVVILILGIGYLFFARLADPIFAGLRGGLDIALDVVNYLNPNPKNRTHRARILSRYASLLRYVADWRDPANPEVGYSRVVIMSHSQGSVISSDLLRALACGTVATDNGLEVIGGDAASGGLPVRFYTMGSPLKQLYASRFPDLFAWDHTEDPRPAHRKLECWWNAYRSGDYVGRMLFRTEKTHKAECFTPGLDFFQTDEAGVTLPVRETCIGPGAHTKYWNEFAPDVIRGLDRLIATDEVAELAKSEKDAKPV